MHAGLASFEYLPSKAFENREYIETRTQDVIVLKGNAKIENMEKENTNLNCELFDVTEETPIELPYIYYLGYNVTLNANEEKINLKTYETENGFIGVRIPITEHGVLTVQYEGTVIMKLSYIVSIISTAIFIGICVKNRKDTINSKD